MQVNSDRRRRTFTQAARRAQIVEATIETVAELGYGRASFARIAERAGLSSTRLISYHFGSKDELMSEVAVAVYGAIGQFMTERMSGQRSAHTALRTYITGVVEFISNNRVKMQALMEIFLNVRADAGDSPGYDADTDRSVLGPIEGILRAGQRSGEFREFDAFVMAATIQRAVDGLPFLLQTKPDLDLTAYAEEVATLFDLATRRSP